MQQSTGVRQVKFFIPRSFPFKTCPHVNLSYSNNKGVPNSSLQMVRIVAVRDRQKMTNTHLKKTVFSVHRTSIISVSALILVHIYLLPVMILAKASRLCLGRKSCAQEMNSRRPLILGARNPMFHWSLGSSLRYYQIAPKGPSAVSRRNLLRYRALNLFFTLGISWYTSVLSVCWRMSSRHPAIQGYVKLHALCTWLASRRTLRLRNPLWTSCIRV